MVDRSYYYQVENEIRAQMALVIQILRPYAQSSGGFNDWNDVRTALNAAQHALEKALTAANYRLPPTR
jgi:hypothetical protein